MKKNKMMRNTAALGVLKLLTASVLSGTLAKYTTSVTGKDEARVAKIWSCDYGKWSNVCR